MIFLSSAYCFTTIPSPQPHRLDSNSHPLPSFRLPSLAIDDHGRRRRVHCLRSCKLLDFHQKLIPYEVAWSLQKDIVREKKSQVEKEGDCTDTLIVLQHPSVFTLGTASSHENLNFDINDPPFHIHRTERGGEVTYHGPGQVLKYSLFLQSIGYVFSSAKLYFCSPYASDYSHVLKYLSWSLCVKMISIGSLLSSFLQNSLILHKL